jgi:hypothetical protein
MAKYSAAWLVEHETPEPVILFDETTLLPKRIPRRRRNTTHNHVADFPFRVATDHMNDPGCSHRPALSG